MTGGCACGAIRYRLDAAPTDTGYCHCRICQRSSGAPVLVFTAVPRDAFVVETGSPRVRQSTPFGERLFCGDCGTQLAMRVDHEPATIDVTVASLDEPARVAPEFHIWYESRIPWFEVADALPRFPRDR